MYYNLVFVRHLPSEKKFLFQVPLNVTLKAGDKVIVDTMYGEKYAECYTNSFVVDNDTLCELVRGVGAYFPLKHVIGRAKEVVKYECERFKQTDDSDLPF